MAFASTSDGVRLFYESAGQGTPLVFVHEFGGNHWSWEPGSVANPEQERESSSVSCGTHAASM